MLKGKFFRTTTYVFHWFTSNIESSAASVHDNDAQEGSLALRRQALRSRRQNQHLRFRSPSYPPPPSLTPPGGGGGGARTPRGRSI
jgi:hypothetical protein